VREAARHKWSDTSPDTAVRLEYWRNAYTLAVFPDIYPSLRTTRMWVFPTVYWRFYLTCFSQRISGLTLILLMWRIEWAPNSIPIYISNKMQRYTVYLYLETALHVSCGTSTHHQERIQLYLQHLVFVTPLLLSAAIVEELEPVWVCCGWRTTPKAHSNRFQAANEKAWHEGMLCGGLPYGSICTILKALVSSWHEKIDIEWNCEIWNRPWGCGNPYWAQTGRKNHANTQCLFTFTKI
jgi:hypothetical protein